MFRQQYRLISVRTTGILVAEKQPVSIFRSEGSLCFENGGSTFISETAILKQ